MAPKKKTNSFYLDHISTPVFKTKWNLIICEDMMEALVKTEVFNDIVEHIYKGDRESAEALVNSSNALTIRIVEIDMFFIVIPKDVTPGVIAHEAFHLTNMICEHRGIGWCSESEETFAHLLDWIVTTIHEMLNEMRKLEKYKSKTK